MSVMRLCALFFASVCALTGITRAQEQSMSGPPTESISTYIDRSWDALTRSMNDCKSFGAPKLDTRPVLYLPADFHEPDEVKHLEEACRVQVFRLPKKITHFG